MLLTNTPERETKPRVRGSASLDKDGQGREFLTISIPVDQARKCLVTTEKGFQYILLETLDVDTGESVLTLSGMRGPIGIGIREHKK